MEEDIKRIEKFITDIKECGLNDCRKNCFDFNLLRNLLTRYKQLEEENTQLKTITQEYNSYLQDSNCDTKIIIADSEYFANGFFKENFIPKSKVKEKIEELKEDEEFYREHDRMYEFESKIKLLQKLLED